MAGQLNGATNEPAPDTEIANAGEFAARWNTWEPEQREKVWAQIQSGVKDGQRCFLEDHDGMKGMVAEQQLRILALQTELREHRSIKPDELGQLAQRFYEAAHDILVLSMTEKVKLVEALRSSLNAIGVATPERNNAWDVEYLHPDCEKCEACAESGIIHAKVTGSVGATYQETEPVPYDRAGDPTFTPKVAHSATVRRAQ